MLGRRITEQIRNQQWVTLAIEFLIVVAGVFIGIQVSNWNQERQERLDEDAILTRMHEETGDLLQVVAAEAQVLERNAALMRQSQAVVFGVDPVRGLTAEECEAIAGSHVYRLGSDELPILNELVQTGRFDRLRNDGIKKQLRRYILLRDRLRSSHEERTNEIYRLYSRHPELVSMDMVPLEQEYDGVWTWLSAEGYRWKPQCDARAMRSSRAFQNEYFDNSGRTGSVLAAYREREEMLTELHRMLGDLLGG